jgi:hypothetical protein
MFYKIYHFQIFAFNPFKKSNRGYENILLVPVLRPNVVNPEGKNQVPSFIKQKVASSFAFFVYETWHRMHL